MDGSSFDVDLAGSADIGPWLALAVTVEHLFGPMVDAGFDRAVRTNIDRGSAYCIRNPQKPEMLAGGMLFDYRDAPQYEISWLAVDASLRGLGLGNLLVGKAMSTIAKPCSIRVVTFGTDNPAGAPARRFYEHLGFASGPTRELGPEGGTRQEFNLRLT